MNLKVFYCFQPTAGEQGKDGFGKAFKWDIDLLEGYEYAFLENVSEQPSSSRRDGCDTPEIGQRLAEWNPSHVIIFGWNLKSYLQALKYCKAKKIPVAVRGDSQTDPNQSIIKKMAKDEGLSLQDLIGNYAETFEKSDLAVTQNLLKKGNTRRFETLNQLLSVVNDVTRFDKDKNFLEQEQKELADMTLDQAHTLINNYLNEQQMIYVVAGDAKTQLSRIKDLGYGDPIVLNKDGDSVE
mgnify:CR=1 FL=1